MKKRERNIKREQEIVEEIKKQNAGGHIGRDMREQAKIYYFIIDVSKTISQRQYLEAGHLHTEHCELKCI